MKDICVEIVEKAKKLGADGAIATGSESTGRQIKFANNKIARTSLEKDKHVELFLSIGKKTGETLINVNGDIEQQVSLFVQLVKKLPDNPEFNGVAVGKYAYSEVASFDSKIAAGEEFVEILNSALDKCSDVRSGGIFETSVDETYLVSSDGPIAEHKSTSVYFSIRCLADQAASGHKVACDNFIDKMNYAGLVQSARELALKSRNPTKGQQGVYNVVFDAFPFAALLDPFVNSTSVFSVESGLSALAGKIGQKVASDLITLTDDPTRRGAFCATPFDAEGFPTRSVPIVEKGVLKTYLHNSSTAKKYGVQSTGHAGISSPHPWNPVLSPGNSKLDELIREAKNGIFISNIWYTRFQNYSTADFSTIPRDAIMLIENGELTRPIREIRISDNLLGILSRAKLLSSDQRQIYGWEVETPIFACDALVENVGITTPQG